MPSCIEHTLEAHHCPPVVEGMVFPSTLGQSSAVNFTGFHSCCIHHLLQAHIYNGYDMSCSSLVINHVQSVNATTCPPRQRCKSWLWNWGLPRRLFINLSFATKAPNFTWLLCVTNSGHKHFYSVRKSWCLRFLIGVTVGLGGEQRRVK